MTRTLRLAAPVVEYARRLAPEARRAVRRALKELKHERGDSRALEVPLAGFYRLRVGRHRIAFCYAAEGAIDAVFREERSLVYEVFEAEFIRKFSQ